MKNIEDILSKILLPINSDWDIVSLKINEEIEVELSYKLPNIEIEGKRYVIYDHRPKRT